MHLRGLGLLVVSCQVRQWRLTGLGKARSRNGRALGCHVDHQFGVTAHGHFLSDGGRT